MPFDRPAWYRANSSRRSRGTLQPSKMMWCKLQTNRWQFVAVRMRASRISGGRERSNPFSSSCLRNLSHWSRCSVRDRLRQSNCSHGSGTSRCTTCMGSFTPSQTKLVRNTGCSATIASHAERNMLVSNAPSNTKLIRREYSDELRAYTV